MGVRFHLPLLLRFLQLHILQVLVEVGLCLDLVDVDGSDHFFSETIFLVRILMDLT